MTAHIPPSAAELEAWDGLITDVESIRLPTDAFRRLITEIEHLRAACGRAARHPWGISTIADEKMKRELRAASKGEVWTTRN